MSSILETLIYVTPFVIIMAGLWIGLRLIVLGIRLFFADPAEYEAMRQRSGGFFPVLFGEVESHIGGIPDARVGSGICVATRFDAKGGVRHVAVPQGRLSTESIVSLVN